MYSLKEERISTITPFSVFADNKRIRNKIIEGKSFQKTRSGKNLFSLDGLSNNASRTTLEIKNNSMIITAIGTGGAQYSIKYIKGLDSTKSYTFSFKGKKLSLGTDGNPFIQIVVAGSNDGETYSSLKTLRQTSPTVNTEYSFSNTFKGYSHYRFYIYNNASTPVTVGEQTEYYDIQLEEGTVATEYEPYGAMPSPEFPSEIQSVGDDVNLFDKNTAMQGYIDYNNGQFTSISTYTSSDFIEINENTNYYCNYIVYNSTSYGMAFYDKDKNYISGSVVANSFVTPSNAKYYRFCVRNENYNGNYITDINTIKLQKGTMATSYSEYGKGIVEIRKCGKNLLNISKIANKDIVVSDNGKTIKMPIATAGNGYLSTTTKLSELCPNLKVGDEVVVRFDTTSKENGKVFLSSPSSFTWFRNTSIVITEDMLKSQLALYGNHYQSGETEQVTITNLSIMYSSETDIEWQEYKGNNYVLPLSQPLRSLPNGVCDTIEEDGIHRRVGSVVLDGSESFNYSNFEGLFWIGINNLGISYKSEYGLSNYFKNIPSTYIITNSSANNHLNDGEFSFRIGETKDRIYFKHLASGTDVNNFETWLQENPIQVDYELAEEVIEPFNEEQQEVINSMETFEGVNHFSLAGNLETTLTFDYNPQITEEIKRAFKYNITKAYLEVAATDKASGFQINEDNYLQSIDFDDCRYIEGEGVIGSCVAKELQGKFVNVDTLFDIENREVECFIGAETEDNITHYLRLGTFIVQKPENDNVKDNTSFDSLDYMIKFNKEYVHRMAKYLKTEDTEIIQDKKYYTLNEGGEYIEVIIPNKEELSAYYEVIDEYTLMQLLKDICNQAGVTLGTFNFRNANYVVQGNRFDSGVTCRDVLKAIAQAAFSWARINEYNELLLDFETSDTISEEIDYNEYYGLNFNDNYGPVNTIVMKNSQAEGENITIKNDDLINSAGGKNLFNNTITPVLKSNITQETLETGIRLISNDVSTGTYQYALFVLKDLKKYVGKVVRMKADFTVTGENKGLYIIGLSTADGKTRTQKSSIYNSGEIASFVVPELIDEQKYLMVWLYANAGGNTVEGDYIDYNNLVVTIDNEDMNYEPFIPLGTKELAILDNPFAYSEETRKAIIQAGEAIYGFKYVPLSVETIGAAYLNCKDKLKIKNMQDEDLETYVFDTRISYQGAIKSNVETLAMTDTETKYRYDGSLTTAQRRTEFKVDKAEQEISSLIKLTTEQGTKLTKATQDLEGFERIIEDTTDKTNNRLVKIEEDINGLVTQKSVSGGQNLIKNSVGYFENDFWQINSETEGTVLSENSTDVKQNSISGSALKLQAETIYQDIKEIKNGEYYLSFNYKKTISSAIATLKVNDLIINLNETDWKQEEHLINVTTNNIKIEMTTDLNSSILITDLMLTEGNLQVSWTQNANESYTDTVQIGKGVRITATGSDTEFVAEASGITINNTESGNKVAEFTKYGTETQELVAHKDVKIADSLLIQKIGNQTWFSSL